MISERARRLWKLTGYEPHEKAMLYHESDARFRFAACGRRFGKSLMIEKDLLADLFDEEKPGRFWIVCLTYDTADEFQYLWDDLVLKLQLHGAPGMKMANNVRTGEMFVEFPWGTRLDVKSIKQPATLVGKGLRRVVMSEAAKMAPVIWKKYISPALADYRGKMDAGSTPEGFNWYYDETLKSGVDPNYEAWNFPSWDNRVLFPGGFDDPEIQRQLPRDAKGNPIDDPWFWQEIGAQFRTMAGMIYPEFNRKVHVKPLEYLPELDDYMGMDFGYNNFAALDAQITPSGEVRVWREYVESERPVHEHAEELRQRGGPEGYRVRCAYGDSADPDAVATIGKKFARCIARSEAKDVKAGIRLVKSFLRSPEGPKLFVDPSCVGVIKGFESYRMKTPRALLTNAASEVEIGDAPLKKDDHEMDALRYLLMHLFQLGGLSNLADAAAGLRAGREPGIFTRIESERIRGEAGRVKLGGRTL